MSVPVEAYRLKTGFHALKKGLHAVRYEAAADPTEAPFFLINPLPEHAPFVELFSSRQDEVNALRAPGDVLVIKASADVSLIITTAVSGTLSAAPPQLQIERLDRPPMPRHHNNPKRALGHLELVDTETRSTSPALNSTKSDNSLQTALLSCGPGQQNLVKWHAHFESGLTKSATIPDFPAALDGQLSKVRFVAPVSYLGKRLLRLEAFFANGTSQDVSGLDVAAACPDGSEFAGFRLREVENATGHVEDVLMRICPVADRPRPLPQPVNASKAFIRRRASY